MIGLLEIIYIGYMDGRSNFPSGNHDQDGLRLDLNGFD